MSGYDYLLKVILVGNSGVGKSSLVQRFVGHKFSENFLPTIGVDFEVTEIEENGKRVKIQTWDCAGLEKFVSITASYYRGAHAAMVVFDVTDLDSILAVPRWVADVRHHNPDTMIFIIGNKSDAKAVNECPLALTSLIQEFKLPPITFTSAKTNHNVQSCFRQLTQAHIAKYTLTSSSPSSSSSTNKKQKEQTKEHQFHIEELKPNTSTKTCCPLM
jgi:small GTP-binding protein